jgi:hypothetical protein
MRDEPDSAVAAELLAGRVLMLAGGAAHPGASPVGGPTVACTGHEVNAGRWSGCAACRHQPPGLGGQGVASPRIQAPRRAPTLEPSR